MGITGHLFSSDIILLFQAAAALLFSQMVYCGVSVEVQPEEMLQACLAVFTDLQQVGRSIVFTQNIWTSFS